MKYAVSLFLVLLVTVSGLLFYQYQAYSDKLESSDGNFNYTQEIEIVYRKDSLDIRQHFTNLPNKSIKINWPIKAVSPDCFLESENSCERLTENKTEFKKSDIRSQSLSYIIPLNKGLKNGQLLKDIFVTLEDGSASYSTVHITTDSDVKGDWISGLPHVGNQKLKLVNYSMFSGTGPVTELYYQSGKLKLQQESKQVSVFSEKPLSKSFKKALKDAKWLNEDHIVIIQSNKNGQQGERVIFLKELTANSLKNNVLLNQVKSQYDFGKSPNWLIEVVATFITDSDFNNKKAKQIVQNLKKEMSNEELKKWEKELNNLQGKKVNAKVLDKILSEILKNNTNYFSLNASTKNVYPFLFNDNREFFVNDKLVEDVNVIFKDNQIYYTARPLLTHFGYKTSIGENGLYVENAANKYRFPLKYGFYMYNNKRYNTVSEPIVTIAGEYYIEEAWLAKLFFVDISKRESSISLKIIEELQQ